MMTLPPTPPGILIDSVAQAFQHGCAVYLDRETPSPIWAGQDQYWLAFWGEVGARAAGAAVREEQPWWREHMESFLTARMERSV